MMEGDIAVKIGFDTSRETVFIERHYAFSFTVCTFSVFIDFSLPCFRFWLMLFVNYFINCLLLLEPLCPDRTIYLVSPFSVLLFFCISK